jgi:hypothetical protein
MDVARKAIDALGSNATAASIFGSNGPSAAELTAIADGDPTYFVLGRSDLPFLPPARLQAPSRGHAVELETQPSRPGVKKPRRACPQAANPDFLDALDFMVDVGWFCGEQ